MPFVRGVYFNLPAEMSATAMIAPAETATPLSVKLPSNGSVVIFTANSELAGESFGSVNPKLATVRLSVVLWAIVTVVDVPTGASLTFLIVTDNTFAVGVEILATIGRAAVVLDLECESGVFGPVRIHRWREDQVARSDVPDRHELSGGDRRAAVGQNSQRRQCRDLYRQQRVGRRVVRIRESEIGSGGKMETNALPVLKLLPAEMAGPIIQQATELLQTVITAAQSDA